MQEVRDVQRYTIVGAIVNILLAVLKITAGIVGFSQALIADGIHSFSDLISDISIIWGSKYWHAAPDKEHPYGHGRIETFVSIGIGIILLMTGIEFMKMGIMNIYHQVVRRPTMIVLFAAVLSVVSKEILYRWTYRKGKQIASRGLIANAWHHRTDALSSVPVIIAFILTRISEELYFVDSIATIIIALFLLKASWDIIWPCIQEMMETQIYDYITKELERLANEHEEIQDPHHILVRKVGNLYYVEMHIKVAGDMNVRKAHSLTQEIKHKAKDYNENIADITVCVEPNDEE